MPQADLRQIKSPQHRLRTLHKRADAPRREKASMKLIERYPNFSTLLIAIAIDAVAAAILLAIAPPKF
jgi:hypothetical protein